jgi:hypothetical protein
LRLRSGPQDPANPLGKDAVTYAEGRYEISFTQEGFKAGSVESGGPDVFIRGYDNDESLRESPVKCNSDETDHHRFTDSRGSAST